MPLSGIFRIAVRILRCARSRRVVAGALPMASVARASRGNATDRAHGPGQHPSYVVQRGHYRQVMFAVDEDYTYCLETLAEFKDLHGVRVYAGCL